MPRLRLDVVVLQVHECDPGMAEGQAMALPVLLDEVVLDHPVALAIEKQGVLLDRLDAVLPHVERLLLRRRRTAARRAYLECAVEVLALDIERRDLPAVREAHLAPTGDVVADFANRVDRIFERHVAEDDGRVFEHSQHEAGRRDL